MAFSGTDLQTIASFVNQNIDNPAAIASAAAKYGVTAADLANATGYSVADVNKYFSNAGLSVDQGGMFPERPTPQPPAPQVQTGYTAPGYKASDYHVANVMESNEPQAFKDLYSALQSGQARVGAIEVPVGGYDAGGTTETQYTVFDAKGKPIPGVSVDPANGLITLPSAGGFLYLNTPIGQGGTLAPVTDFHAQVGYQGGSGNNLLKEFSPFLGIAAAAFGVPGIIGSALAPAASAATQAALGGAVFGGGMAGITGQNIGKGALLGGALAYGGSQLGQYLNSGVTDANLLQQAADADMAAGMLPQYGTNAAYDAAMQNLMAGSPGAVQQLQDVVNSQVGGNRGPDNIDVGGGFNPATGMGDYATAQAANPYLNTPTATVPGTTTPGVVGPTTTPPGPLTTTAGGAGTLLSKLTENPLTTAAIVNAGAGLINTQNTKSAINNALNTQLAAGQQAGSTLKDIYGQQLGFVAPYQQAGLAGLNLIGQNKDYLTHQFDATDLAKGLAPNYNFMLQQGQMANQRLANVGGGALSGNTLQGLNQFTQNYAGNAYQNAFQNYQNQRQNIFNTLSSIAGMGQTANAQAIGAGTNYGQQQTNLATGLAAAQAGATMGQSQNQANLISNLANNVTLASLLGQKQAVGTPTA